MSQVEGACNRHADCRNVHQSCCQIIECSFLYHKLLQLHFREFVSTSNWPHNRRPRAWRRVGERFADDVLNKVPHGEVMVWAGMSDRQQREIAFYQWQFDCTDTVMRS